MPATPAPKPTSTRSRHASPASSGTSYSPPPLRAPPPAPAPAPRETQRTQPTFAPRKRDGVALEDLLGGQVLAWLGGAATLVGIGLLLAIAASRGWIGESERSVMAAVASLALLVLGGRLYERRGRTDAAGAMTAAGLAGLFATITVAAQAYELIPGGVGFALALLTGAAATGLALRWNAKGVAALGLLGALAGPLFAGAPLGAGTVVSLAIAFTAAAAVCVHRRWDWLGLAAFAIVTPQWLYWLYDDSPALAPTLIALAAFGALNVAAAAGFELRTAAATLRPAAALLLALNAIVLAAAGFAAIDEAGARGMADAWLAIVAVAHLAVGLGANRMPRVSHELALTSLALGVLAGDVAAATLLGGLPLALAWTGSAVAIAALGRIARRRTLDDVLIVSGIGLHTALALGHALVIDAPPAGGHGMAAAGVLALAAVAAGCFVSARLTSAAARLILDVLGLAVVAYLTAYAIDGPALAAAWAAEAVALARIARREHDPIARAGAAAFLSLAALNALTLHAMPGALIDGLDAPLAALLALGAVAAATLAAAWIHRDERPLRDGLLAAAAIGALYLASAELITAFQPGVSDLFADGELSVRQQGQVLLSGMWALIGVATVLTGLRRDVRGLRLGALALLGVAIAKVFVYDLAELESIYRVASFIGLGALLLLAAFAWQRLRPRDRPDLALDA